MANDGNSGTKADKVQRWPAYAVAAVALLFALADFLTEPGKMKLTAEVLFAILIAFAAVFAGQFDKVNFVKLLSLERDFRSEKQDKKEAVERADRLASLLVSNTSVAQSQATTNVTLNVERETDEIDEDQDEGQGQETPSSQPIGRAISPEQGEAERQQRRQFFSDAFKLAIEQVVERRDSPKRVVREVSLEEDDAARIFSRKEKFDALLAWDDFDEFLEVTLFTSQFEHGSDPSLRRFSPIGNLTHKLLRIIKPRLLLIEKYGMRTGRRVRLTMVCVIPNDKFSAQLVKLFDETVDRILGPAIERDLFMLEVVELDRPEFLKHVEEQYQVNEQESA